MLVSSRCTSRALSVARAHLRCVQEETQDSPASASSLPLDLILLADTLPFTNVRELKDDIYCKLVDWLPVPGDAASLVDTYYTNAAWMFNPMPREELLETVLKHVYPAQNAGPTLSEIRPHDLAVLCSAYPADHACRR